MKKRIQEVTAVRFPTSSSTPRPVRLPENLRRWAHFSQTGAYGDEAMRHFAVHLPESEQFKQLSPIDQQDQALLYLCRHAPLRICKDEEISGSATLGTAFRFPGHWHAMPVLYQGNALCGGVSHLTIRYDRVLKEGMQSYERQIAARMEDATLTDRQKRYLASLQNAIEGMRIFHKRYLDATRDTKPQIHALLRQVPFSPARTFHEAVQSVWFVFVYTRLLGSWPGIGLLDRMLWPYLRQDLENGQITLGRAREILASFFIKGCEWIENPPPGTGDAQFYQNLVLAGRDENGKETCNPVTYLILDIVEELGISDFPITVRLHKNSPEKLLRKMAQVIRHGGGVVAAYNEETVFDIFRDQGYPPCEIPLFANDGCWEMQIPGCTNFLYTPFDALQTLNRALGLQLDHPPHFDTAEQVYQAFLTEMEKDIENVWQISVGANWTCENGQWQFRGDAPYCPHIDLFEDGCIENARSYYDLGPRYTVRSPHIGGAPDVSNSLYAIEKAVFEDQLLTMDEMIDCLKNNWEGQEVLRRHIRARYTWYGNDCDPCDRWHTRVLHDFALLTQACARRHPCPVRFIPGVSTFGRQVDWLPARSATCFGARKGDILAGNDSPTPGTDTLGATAVIRSHCKAALREQQSGAALDLKIFPESLKGENGIQTLKALLRGFVQEKGLFLQLDAVDVQTLLDARAHPENYKGLSVRVSGWNARFVTLCEEWQNMIIERTGQHM